ncbi:MAG: serine/threonine protein kinase [Actinomycetia bacterium]|nr:serine/threonine protein kinase [Actinomycetes bacterium]MCP4961122.1 serine/threonine protein kinase [Actinomycetes bacterium]
MTEELQAHCGIHPGVELIPRVYAWQLLGDGKWCESWIAWSMVHGHPVTVKRAQSLDTADEARAVLRREAKRLKVINHPAFQRLLGGDLEAELPFLVLDYIDGPTLGPLLDEEGPFTLDDALTTVAELAAAIGYMHHLGLAHMDLKPNNAVLRDGRVVLLDVGLATLIGKRPSAPRGTKGYVAPEHWHGAPVAPTSDVFSLGAILFELLTVKAPFARDSEPKAIPDLTHVHMMSPPVADLVSDLLALDPANRIATADEALRRAASLLPDGERGWPEFLRPTLEWTSVDDVPLWLWDSRPQPVVAPV